MSENITNSWRGVVGVIKPTFRPGSLEEFIRLLPEGIGIIPLYLGIHAGTEKEFIAAMEATKQKVAELAKMHVDLIHPESSSVFTIRGYHGAEKIAQELEREYGVPVVTTGMMEVEALRALKVKRMIGVTYHQGELNEKNASYFREAGFEVLGMEGLSVPFSEVGRISPHDVYAFAKQQYLKHQDAQGIYLLGSGWHVLEVIEILEADLQVPVIHPVAARIWGIQKRLHVRQPVKRYGRLLAEMP